jgi:hypothetical protein
MTKYSIRIIEGRHCAIADPDGCFYSTGEIDRYIKSLREWIRAHGKTCGHMWPRCLECNGVSKWDEDTGFGEVIHLDGCKWVEMTGGMDDESIPGRQNHRGSRISE